MQMPAKIQAAADLHGAAEACNNIQSDVQTILSDMLKI